MKRQRLCFEERRRRVVLLVLAGMLSAGCAVDGEGASREDRRSTDADGWRDAIGSSDPVARARAVDLVAGEPGDDGLATVETLAVHDPDARVREQAVLAYGVLAGADAEQLLKDIALGDESEAVTSTARAALARLHAERPVRAWMKVDYPETYSAGETVVVRVHFGSEEAAPKATIQLRPPRGFTADGPLRWRGSIEAGVPQVVAFELVAGGDRDDAGAAVRLHVDYEEQLDDEVLLDHVRVRGDATGGRFAGPLPTRVRDTDGVEVSR